MFAFLNFRLDELKIFLLQCINDHEDNLFLFK